MGNTVPPSPRAPELRMGNVGDLGFDETRLSRAAHVVLHGDMAATPIEDVNLSKESTKIVTPRATTYTHRLKLTTCAGARLLLWPSRFAGLWEFAVGGPIFSQSSQSFGNLSDTIHAFPFWIQLRYFRPDGAKKCAVRTDHPTQHGIFQVGVAGSSEEEFDGNGQRDGKQSAMRRERGTRPVSDESASSWAQAGVARATFETTVRWTPGNSDADITRQSWFLDAHVGEKDKRARLLLRNAVARDTRVAIETDTGLRECVLRFRGKCSKRAVSDPGVRLVGGNERQRAAKDVNDTNLARAVENPASIPEQLPLILREPRTNCGKLRMRYHHAHGPQNDPDAEEGTCVDLARLPLSRESSHSSLESYETAACGSELGAMHEELVLEDRITEDLSTMVHEQCSPRSTPCDRTSGSGSQSSGRNCDPGVSCKLEIYHAVVDSNSGACDTAETQANPRDDISAANTSSVVMSSKSHVQNQGFQWIGDEGPPEKEMSKRLLRAFGRPPEARIWRRIWPSNQFVADLFNLRCVAIHRHI